MITNERCDEGFVRRVEGRKRGAIGRGRSSADGASYAGSRSLEETVAGSSRDRRMSLGSADDRAGDTV